MLIVNRIVAGGEWRAGRRFGGEKLGRKNLWLEKCDPGCFLQEWQTKELWVTGLVRVAIAGLKVAGFSVSCRSFARVAGKGLRK